MIIPNPSLFENWKDWAFILASTFDNTLFQQKRQDFAVEPKRYFGASGEPPFLNNWVNLGGGPDNLGFQMLPFGFVLLSGAVKKVAAPVSPQNIAGPLPSEYWPRSSGGGYPFINTVVWDTVYVGMFPANIAVSATGYVVYLGVPPATDVASLGISILYQAVP